jgi:hypothetical protein
MGMSTWHLLVLIVIAATFIVPFYRIFPRAGIPAWVAIFGIVPFVPLIFLWVLAFKRWPGDK